MSFTAPMSLESIPGVPAQWSDQAVHIKDFSGKHSIPNVVKVIKGQYRNIGVSKSVHSELYVHNVQTMNKVLAEAIKVKEGKTKVTVSEQKYSLPMSYNGWFELLSQDGKSVHAIQNIQELSRFFPPTCLVRENMKAFISNGGKESNLEHTRTVLAGEVLTLVGEIWVPFPMGRTMGKRRVLKCTDTKGKSVFFGLEQKGTFSPIAGQTNISGVHSIKGILDKFRLPVMVRLVHGVIPSKMEKGFTGIFRFINIYSDENVFVCPLRRDAKMVPISTREPIKVVAIQDYKNFSKLEDVQAVQRKCVDMMASYLNSIHILISMPDVSMFRAGEEYKTNKNSIWAETIPEPTTSPQIPPSRSISQDEEDLLFEEIDGIYQYVREGGVPPKPKARSTKTPPRKKEPSPVAKKPTSTAPMSVPTAPVKAGFGDMFHETDDDPLMEIKMQQLDLDDEDEDERTTLKRQDSYNWEEPIYEPLDKIRQLKKKQDAQKPQDNNHIPPVLVSGFDTPPDSLYKDDDGKDEENTRPVSASPSSPSLIEVGAPVANLRQVMRSLSSTPDASRPKSLALSTNGLISLEAVDPAIPPPLPPKRYSGGDAHSPDVPTKSTSIGNIPRPYGIKSPSDLKSPHRGKSQRDTKTPQGIKSTQVMKTEGVKASKGVKSAKGVKSSAVEKSSKDLKSQAKLSKSHNNNNNKQQAPKPVQLNSSSPPKQPTQSPFSSHTSSSSSSSNSLQQADNKVHTSPAGVAAPVHPPYVAVARVRDYQQDTAMASVLVNPDVYAKHRNGMSNGQNMHSMYL